MIADKLYAIGAPLANHLWQSTLFAGAVWMLTLVFNKNQARVRYSLWMAASLKFLLPFSLLILAGDHLARVNRPAPTVFYLVVQRVSQPFHQVSHSGAVWVALLPQLIAVLWLAGLVTVLSLWCLHLRRVAATIRAAVPMSEGREMGALRRREQLAKAAKPIALWLSQSSTEPGVYGIARPILLWPAAISDRLQDTHLEAIVAHEVEHVRRHDNLTATLHMLVEAIFWFHPLVWWLGARLIEEREWACDEEVLRQGSAPEIYAESILQTCEFCVAPPLACVSGVTGADLKRRIVRIMTERTAQKLNASRKVLLVAMAVSSVAAPVVAGLVKTPMVKAQAADTAMGTLDNPYHVGGDVSAPKLVYAPDPEFTEKARKAKHQGVCVITTIVDTDGKPQRIQVVRRLGMGLDKKAMEAVQQYKFTPALRDGKPVDVQVNIEVNFRIN